MILVLTTTMMLTILVIVALFLLLMYRSAKRPRNYPPGPTRFPLIGSFLSIDPKQPSKTFKQWADEYGGIYSVKVGGEELVVLTDPGLIKEAMMTSPDFLNRPNTFNFRFFLLYKNAGLIASWGSVWKEHRRFSLRHLKDFGFGKSSVEDIVKIEINEQIKRLAEKFGEPLELNYDFNIAITNIIWSITAGHRFDVDSKEVQDLHGIMNEFFSLQNKLFLIDFFPWLLHILPKSVLKVDRAKQLNDIFLSFFRDEIESHKQTFKMNGKDRDLVDVYLRKLEEESGNPGFNREEEEFNLLAVIGDLFVAGGETTYTTLRWTFTILVKYPHIQEKIQKELDEVLGQNRTPTLDDRSNLPYLEAFITEVQRVSNIAAMGVPHVATRNSKIGGYTIPKGTQVIANLFGLHMSPKFWEDPEVFRPERFLNGNGEVIKPDAFMPFGFGRRQCLGESLAKTELFLYISCLLQQLSFVAVDDPDDIRLESEMEGIVRYPKRYKMIVTRRKKVADE